MVAETDFLMGQVLDAAKASGVYDDTIVIFLSDHGEMNMEHRQVWKNAQSLRGVRARAAQCAALLDTARKSLTLDPWRGKARHKPSALLLLLDRRSALQYAAICCNMLQYAAICGPAAPQSSRVVRVLAPRFHGA